jgi:hypothetical protein
MTLPYMTLEYIRYKREQNYQDKVKKKAIDIFKQSIVRFDKKQSLEYRSFKEVETACHNAIIYVSGKEREYLVNLKDQAFDRMIERNKKL